MKKNYANNNGFTLVEMAVVLVVIGLILGMGVSMIGPLSNRVKINETRESISANMEAISSWAANNNTIPDTARFASVAKTPNDAWGRNFIYLYDSNLYSATPTKDTICGRKSTSLSIINNGVAPAATISNVAYLVLSSGDDGKINTTASDGKITGSRVATDAITLDATFSDIVRWVTLDELRSKIGCQGAQLKILNNELPYGSKGSSYSDVYIIADGGLGAANFQWCVENTTGTAPAGLTFHQNTATGTSLTSIFSTNCSAGPSWESATQLVVNGTPTLAGSHSLKLFVRDGTGISANSANKLFVLTINPS